MEYKLYHSTIDTLQKSIQEKGLVQNTAKYARELKSWTDLFNHFLLYEQGKFLPEKLEQFKPIDRNTAIFLSALPIEFKKSKHAMIQGEKIPGNDIIYECTMNRDLPAFDSSIFETTAKELRGYLGKRTQVSEFLSQAENPEKEKQRFSELIKYLMSQSSLQTERRLSSISRLKQDSHQILNQGIQRYCESGLLATEIQDNYQFFNNHGKIGWFRVTDRTDLPEIIGSLEILCNQPIPNKDLRQVSPEEVSRFLEGI